MPQVILVITLLLLPLTTALAEESKLYSYKVVDLKTSQVLAEQNPEKLMIPASTHKLITAYAALKMLGSGYRFETQISADGKVINKTLQGNLYIKFDGNPDFSTKDIAALISRLKEKGINKIGGNIVIDTITFDDKFYPDGWLIEDRKFYYAAPISAIIIDQNSVTVKLNENNQGLELIEYNIYPKIQNEVRLIQNHGTCDCELELEATDSNIYRLYGCHKKGAKLPTLKIAIQNPKLWAKDLLRFYFTQNNINYNEIIFDKSNTNARKLFSFQSRPLHELIKTFLQDSNNLIGEVLLKTLAAKKKGIGSFQEGADILTEFLSTELNIDSPELRIKDGSGLSRKNLISANTLLFLLQRIHKSPPHIKEAILSALPGSAESGTLVNRFLDPSCPKGFIVAKTGSMENVSSIAGYIQDNSGEYRYAFVIMVNNALSSIKEMKQDEEEFIKNLLSNRP